MIPWCQADNRGVGMSKFIKLTRRDNPPVYINIDKIVAISAVQMKDQSNSCIDFGNHEGRMYSWNLPRKSCA